MNITVRFSTDNGPTSEEVEWIKNAIQDTLNHRLEVRNPKVLSIITDPSGVIPIQPVLSEELWQAIERRMQREEMFKASRTNSETVKWGTGDPGLVEEIEGPFI